MHTVKALDAEGTRVGGYLLTWGDPAHRDLHREYFTPQTDLALDWFARRPVLYHHGLDPDCGPEAIGMIDTIKADSVGLWCEAQLEKHHRYLVALRTLVAQNALGWSSGSLPHLVRKATDGAILRWPLVEASLTPTPAQPYTTSVAAVKAAFESLGLNPQEVEEFAMTDQITQLNETITNLTNAVKTLQSPTPAPYNGYGGAIKRLPVPAEAPRPPQIEVTRATRYGDLSAADMSFLYDILSSSPRGWRADTPFLRELADKTLKAVNTGALPADAARAIKANELDSTAQSGYGAEWAADSWRAELWSKVRQDNVVAPLFNMIELPTNPYELPFESTDPTVYYVPETADASQLTPAGSAIPSTKVGTGKITMTAKKLALRLAWSGELNEDSILPIVATYRGQAIRAMQNAVDYAILNGDTVTSANTNINLIDGTPGANAKYLVFNGLRKYCILTHSGQNIDADSVPTLALMRTARFKLDPAYALRPRELAWICDDQTYSKLLNLEEFATMDKAGAAATNLTGQVGVIDGVPVFASAELGLSRSDGKISATSGNNVFGSAIIVARPNWLVGYRRQVQAAVEYLSYADAYHLTLTARLTLAAFDGASAAMLSDLEV
jgi:HK97 family phage major capsid protein